MATACARPPHADTTHPGDRSGGTAQPSQEQHIYYRERGPARTNESTRQDPSFLLFCSRALYMYDTIAPPARSSSPPACHPRARRGLRPQRVKREWDSTRGFHTTGQDTASLVSSLHAPRRSVVSQRTRERRLGHIATCNQRRGRWEACARVARDAARLCACLVVARQPGGEGREAVVPSAGGVHPLARRVLEDERALVTQLLRSPRPHPPLFYRGAP